jgi:DNA polymerase-3 subunit beta
MKTTIQVSQINKALQSLKRNVNGKTLLPILECVLFEFQDSKLKLTTSDLENTHSIVLDVQDAFNGAFAVQCDVLAETLKNVTDLTASFIFGEKSLEIKTKKGKYEMPIFDANEFPRQKPIVEAQKIPFNSERLIEAISKAVKFTGDDALRPALTGVYVCFENQKTTVVATDANKMYKFEYDESYTDEKLSFLLSKNACNILSGITNIDEISAIQINENNVCFDFGNQTLTSVLIDAKYPNYEAVIPKDNPIQVSVSKKEIENSLKTLLSYANRQTSQIALNVGLNSIEIQSQDIDNAKFASETVFCQNNTSEIKIGVNGKYFVSALSVVNTENAIMEMSQPSRAILLFPEGGFGKTTILVMPVILN